MKVSAAPLAPPVPPPPEPGPLELVSLVSSPQPWATIVPTPAIVAPIEFTMRLDDYRALGGHMDHVRTLQQVLARGAWHDDGAPQGRRHLNAPAANAWPIGQPPMLG